MDKIAFPYRSSKHLPLLHVIAESGAWERHGLEVEYNRKISSTDAHAAVPRGDVEFVGGNHLSPYGHRARGDEWVYLGQTINVVSNQLIVRSDSGINSVADLREKTVGSHGSHPMLNDWLYLKSRGLDTDRDDVAIIEPNGDSSEPLWHLVRDRKVDAAFMRPPSNLIAQQHGLKAIDIEPLPMIYFTTISSSLHFVEQHPQLVDRFLKGIIEGIHFFKTKPAESTKIIQERYTKEGRMDDEVAAATYQSLAKEFEPKLYPTMAAIANVYQQAVRKDADAKRVNPMELWDLHFIRQIDDSGFVNDLYRKP